MRMKKNHSDSGILMALKINEKESEIVMNMIIWVRMHFIIIHVHSI